MSQKSLFDAPPGGVLRFLLRLPIRLYRLNLGWVLGERFVLLNHIGRKTGQVRQTVVEVVGHNPESDTYYIVSGWGYQANWYRNLIATPDIAIQVGRRKLEVHTETLSPGDGAQVLLEYRQQHPLAARELGRIMGFSLSAAPPQDLEQVIEDRIPVVALQARAV